MGYLELASERVFKPLFTRDQATGNPSASVTLALKSKIAQVNKRNFTTGKITPIILANVVANKTRKENHFMA